jgi:hypothetical protein
MCALSARVKEATMTLHVQYSDGKYDYVNGGRLDKLIDLDRLRQFYRPSEKRWVDVEFDRIRSAERIIYIGPERRSLN